MSPDRQDDLIATVDEIEEGESGERLAVLVFDDGQQLVVPLERLPDGTRDGSVLRVRFRLDRDTERERRDEVRDLQRRLFGPEE
ncbi:DUF3006 domain-containing protein [Sphaerobacter sp.]|uniref:DUF3006 domain-containing protein n=1 Tax=Sphaerobacter sp. TaxID=2099654 RepID=UPI001DF08647|nr:DUF3006 domain-containing protein [Sphaerobacter sp.]MBX5443851.1 DUF3006 domain-containing protein [Sphaerobacter sp.]